MRINNVILVLASCVSAWAQSKPIMGFGIGNRTGNIHGETRIEPTAPPGSADHIAGGVMGDRNGWFHRFMTDRGQKKYFGYDFLLEPADQVPGEFRLTFRALSVGPEKLVSSAEARNWSSLPLPQYPAPQTVHYGDTVAFDLLTNPATGQRIVEYLTVRRESALANPFAGPSRDFKVSDAELRFMDARVAVNGSAVDTISADTVSGGGGITAIGVWFYLAGHGRFFLSLTPGEGFLKVGEVRDNTLSFTVGNTHYKVTCSEKIAPGPDAYTLYVRHELAYQPPAAGRSPTFFFAASH